MAKVTILGNEYEYKRGTTYKEIARDVQSLYDSTIIIADVDGKYTELNKCISSDVDVKFVTISEKAGYKVLRRTMMMVMFKAIYDLYGNNNIDRVKAEYSIGKGIFCTVNGSVCVDDKFVNEVKAKMQEIIDADIPIVKTSYKLSDAIKIFEDAGMTDKVKLFKYRRTSSVNIYSIEDYKDYYHGDMAPSTGYSVPFDLYLYDTGFVLQFAAMNDLSKVAEKSNQPKVFKAICALDKAVTTAGSYRNYFKDETSGKIYSHAIDPKTGYPVAHQTMSVTVISDSAFESDALDTGLLVLGADKALAWGEKNQYAIATIEYKDGKTVFRYTDKFKPYLDCAKR